MRKWTIGLALGAWVASHGDTACTLGQNALGEYEIANYEQLKQVGTTCPLDGTYRLVSDIDASPSAGENCDAAGVCAGFTPIGSYSVPFAGTFHGGGYVISGLSINRPGSNYAGLFAVSSGTLDSLGLPNAHVTASGSAGVLAGKNSGSINACHSGGSVAIQRRDAGGLVGYNTGHIQYCYAKVSVSTARADAGGLVGTNSGSIGMSYAEGAVSGPSEIGGLVGWTTGGSINACYAVGSVLGSGEYIGGLVGWGQASISASYASGHVTGSGYKVGGLVGYQLYNGSLSSSYWDTESSGRSSGGLTEIPSSDGSSGSSTAPVSPSQAQGLSTIAMQQQSSFAGWDFEHTWILYEGYTAPLLRAFMKPLVVGVADAVKVYDGATFAAPALAYSPEPIEASLLLGTPNYTGSGLTAVGAGTYELGLDGGLYSTQQGYILSYASPSTLTINKAPLSVEADTVRKTYGAVDPALSYKVTGLVGSDQLSGSLSRATGENAGPYDIDQGTLSASNNYNLSFTGAKLHIAPAPLSVEADTVRKTYGESDPLLTYKPTGLVGSDQLSGALSRVSGENVGSYAIALGTLSAGSNYDLTYTGAALKIKAAPLSVEADTVLKTYGESDPLLTYKPTGLVGSDQLSGALSRAVGENVGSYAIEQGTLSAGSNYDLTYTGAALKIKAAPLSISVQNDTITLGDTSVVWRYAFSGFVNGDDSTVLTRLAVNHVMLDTVGIYKLSLDASAANYEISLVDGSLIVLPPLGLASSLPAATARLEMRSDGLHVQGLRGKLDVYSLQGQRMTQLYIARDGVYALNLAPGRYMLRQGAQGWALNLR